MILSSLSGAVRLNISAARAEALKAAFVALFLGAGLVYLTGFSTSDTAHDAAHDTRHSLSFPCH
ncbi:MAG: CbtB domain-containing protein [Methylocystis sp.]|jgi:cobalt transporter subunit CbtB